MQTIDVSGPKCMKLSMFGLPIVIPVNAFRAVLDTLQMSPVDGNLCVVLRPIDNQMLDDEIIGIVGDYSGMRSASLQLIAGELVTGRPRAMGCGSLMRG